MTNAQQPVVLLGIDKSGVVEVGLFSSQEEAREHVWRNATLGVLYSMHNPAMNTVSKARRIGEQGAVP